MICSSVYLREKRQVTVDIVKDFCRQDEIEYILFQ